MQQRDALRTVLGMNAGPAPDQVLIGLAVLSLRSHGAEQQPLVPVDDLQRLDRALAQVQRAASGQSPWAWPSRRV